MYNKLNKKGGQDNEGDCELSDHRAIDNVIIFIEIIDGDRFKMHEVKPESVMNTCEGLTNENIIVEM